MTYEALPCPSVSGKAGLAQTVTFKHREPHAPLRMAPPSLSRTPPPCGPGTFVARPPVQPSCQQTRGYRLVMLLSVLINLTTSLI